jgi:hypothetical protein
LYRYFGIGTGDRYSSFPFIKQSLSLWRKWCFFNFIAYTVNATKGDSNIGQLLINGWSNCGITSKAKLEIEALIFLLIAEIEKRKRETAE